MEYILLIAADEANAPRSDEQTMAAWLEYNQVLIDGGHYVTGASLQPTATATTLAKRDTDSSVLDGPFAETKEQLLGFYLIKAAHLDEALALAGRMPIPYASIEVRPIAFRPGM